MGFSVDGIPLIEWQKKEKAKAELERRMNVTDSRYQWTSRESGISVDKLKSINIHVYLAIEDELVATSIKAQREARKPKGVERSIDISKTWPTASRCEKGVRPYENSVKGLIR